MTTLTAASVMEAAAILGIGEQASLNEIRHHYHERIRQWHPDVSQKDPASSHEMTIRLMEAFNLLFDYGMNHIFSFRLEDLQKDLEQNLADDWMERFGDDPIWS
jgi:DnaJ-class molecular chaperone